MSSDNGIYVARFPKNDGYEWRVSLANAIDNCDLSWMNNPTATEDAYRFLYFGTKKSFASAEEAFVYAVKLSSGTRTEYGVCALEFDRPLVEMTIEQAENIAYGR
jgi:hypothetical protein